MKPSPFFVDLKNGLMIAFIIWACIFSCAYVVYAQQEAPAPAQRTIQQVQQDIYITGLQRKGALYDASKYEERLIILQNELKELQEKPKPEKEK